MHPLEVNPIRRLREANRDNLAQVGTRTGRQVIYLVITTMFAIYYD